MNHAMNHPGAATEAAFTRAERHAAGHGLRRRVKRGHHAQWEQPADRPDPVGILQAQGAHRIPELLPIRYGRMRASPLAFLRGAAAVMAADLAGTPATGINVQSCGDCHLANFGSYATPEGLPIFDINDFDETLAAPFEWDLKRLATSFVLSGREQGLSQKACRHLAVSAVRAYAQEMQRLAAMPPMEAWSSRIDLLAAIDTIPGHQARARAHAALKQRMQSAKDLFGLSHQDSSAGQLHDKPPLVMRLPAHDAVMQDAFARYVAMLSPERRLLLDRYRLRDVVFKVVGVGSVGTFCAIGLFMTADGAPLLLQIKEAQPSVLAPFAGASRFHNAGQRVVIGQRIMQAASDLFLGWTADDADCGSGTGRQFYVRHLKDSRLAALGLEVEAHGLANYAHLCGRALGRAHARSGDRVVLAGYCGAGGRIARAIADFAVQYADRTERDWGALKQAIAEGRIAAAEG